MVFILSTIFGKKFTILYINPLILFSSNYSKKTDIILLSNNYMLVVKIVSSYDDHIKYIMKSQTIIELVKYYPRSTEINYTNIKLNYDINLIMEKLTNLNNLEIKPIILMSYLFFLPKRYDVSQDNVHNMIPNGEKAYDVTIFHSALSIHKFFKNNYKLKKIKIS